MSEADKKAQAATRAGRGVLSITASKLYFIVAGYAVQLLLPQFLASPEAFGLYSSAMGVVSILTNVIIVATIQTVSKHVSGSDNAPARLRDALRTQLLLGSGLGLSLYLGADALAAHVLLDHLLAPLFRSAAVVVFCYALYAAIVGYLNGCQDFQRQAFFDLTYTTLRTGFILGAAALGFGAFGSVTGFALAATLVLAIALFVVGTGAPSEDPLPARAFWAFMAPLFVYHLCLNLILQVDLALLKRTIADLAQASGQSVTEAASTASRYAGFYRGAQTFAFVPYQLILSVAFVIFPMISQASTLGDEDTARTYIRSAMRFSLIVLLAIAAPVSGASDGVLRIAYPEEYLAGQGALSVLSLGMVAFALFVIAATILSGAGLPQVAAGIALISVLIVVGCNLGFVYATGLHEGALRSAAFGTSCGAVASLLLSGLSVYRRFGAFMPPLSALRTLLAAGVGYAVAGAMPSGTAIDALLALIAGGIAYLVALVVVREVGKQDLAVLTSLGKKN